MNEVGRKIVFNNLQLQKGNGQRKIQKELAKNLELFKVLPNLKEFDETFNYLYKNKSTNVYITANLFPGDINLIARYREDRFSNNLEYEIRWQMKVFSIEKDKINEFIKLKKIVDEQILLNQYKDAFDLLSLVEKRFGVSCWLLENKIFLMNKLGIDTQQEIIEKVKNGVLTTILSFYNMRSSNEVSSRDYEYFTNKEISKFKRLYPDNKVISFYHYMIAPFSFLITDESILYVFSYMYNMPLIDRYLFVTDLCEYMLTHENNDEYKTILRSYITYMEEISDSSVEVYRFLLDAKEHRKTDYHIIDLLLPIKNKYVLGDVDGCYQDIISLLKEGMSDIAAFNIYIEICHILKKEVTDLNLSDNINMILRNLNSLYSISENYNNAIDEIYKLCFSCIHATWSRDIYNHINRRNRPYKSNVQQLAVLYTNMQKLTIETICENLPKEEAADFLKSINIKENNYVEFWLEYVLGNFAGAIVRSGLKPLKIFLSLIECENYDAFNKELSKEKISLLYKIRIANIMWDNMSHETYIEEGIDYFLHLFFHREEYVIIAPIKKFMGYLSDTEYVDKSNLRVPILYFIYTTYFDSEKREDLSIICEDFFYYNNIERPSLMEKCSDKYSKEALIFFLRYICIPQIMGPVLLSIKSSKDLDQERINTCQYLRILDPDNEDIYEQEIRDITHKLFINEGLNSIENSKIHVNTEGIKSRISKSLKSAFNNYVYSRNHKIDAFLEIIKNIEGGENLKIITFDSTQLFNEIIYTIRNEFVSSGEYGLDGYLSLNIRHGTLAAQLRAPLAKYNLLSTYIVESGEYEINLRWLHKVQSYHDKERVIAAIIEFNKETDGIIEYLRKTLIQVSTEEKPSKGIFDYTLSESEISFLQTLLTENCEFEEFIDKIFEYLWKITEYNLEKMKEIIRDEIKQRYIGAFTKLSNVMKDINKITPFPEAIRWLNEAQNDVDAELEKICNWFKRSAESQHADFDLDLAFQIGFKMIENIHPEKKFVVECLNKDFASKIPGVYLKNYWNIFYTLFDNVSKYALEIDGVKYISCDLMVDDSNIRIKMTNAYDCSNDIIKEETRIKNALSLISDTKYLARAQQEGGSGIPKIYKILSVDLNKRANIKCDFVRDKNQFVIDIEGRNK